MSSPGQRTRGFRSSWCFLGTTRVLIALVCSPGPAEGGLLQGCLPHPRAGMLSGLAAPQAAS